MPVPGGDRRRIEHRRAGLRVAPETGKYAADPMRKMLDELAEKR
jgi:hypothetical protein